MHFYRNSSKHPADHLQAALSSPSRCILKSYWLFHAWATQSLEICRRTAGVCFCVHMYVLKPDKAAIECSGIIKSLYWYCTSNVIYYFEKSTQRAVVKDELISPSSTTGDRQFIYWAERHTSMRTKNQCGILPQRMATEFTHKMCIIKKGQPCALLDYVQHWRACGQCCRCRWNMISSNWLRFIW